MRRLRGCLRWCIIGGAPLSVTLGCTIRRQQTNMKTELLSSRPRRFQFTGDIIVAGWQMAIGIAAVALSSVSAHAAWPWFSGYINSTNSYRIYAFTDWDTPLFGVGIYPDTDCLGVESPAYRVDGHVVYEADGTGNCVAIESTGSYAVSVPLGSIHPVASSQFGGWWQNPASAPISDTRHDWSSQFLNVVSDPVGVLQPTNATPISASIALATSTVVISWPSDTNRNYKVMWSAQIATTNSWCFLGTAVAGNGTTNTVIDSLTNSSRFYRVISVE